MALLYRTVKRRILSGDEAGMEKWFGQLKTSGRLDFDQVCEQVAHHSTATHGDVSVVVKEVLQKLADALAEGNIVNLGRVGKFRLTAGSRGADSKEEFRLHYMKTPKVVFSPGKRLRTMMKEVGFVREPIKVTVIPYEECEEHPLAP